jgi:hypothetical protein
MLRACNTNPADFCSASAIGTIDTNQIITPPATRDEYNRQAERE